MHRNLLFSLLIIGTVVLVVFGINTKRETPNYDAFAQCIASKGITMYGADWCTHCQNEKNAFGDSFRFVPYVECPADPKRCLDAGIKGYPTWDFADGRRFEGEMGVVRLAEESGCSLAPIQ